MALVAPVAYFSSLTSLEGNYGIPSLTDFSSSNKSHLGVVVSDQVSMSPEEVSQMVTFFLKKLSENATREKSWGKYKVEGTHIKFYKREEKGHNVMLFTKDDFLSYVCYQETSETQRSIMIKDNLKNGYGISVDDECLVIEGGKTRFKIDSSSVFRDIERANRLYLGRLLQTCMDFKIPLD
jgi:hypothetical protein